MSDYIHYTSWRQRENALAAELELGRATTERLDEGGVVAGRATAARVRRWRPRVMAAVIQGIVRPTR